MAPKPKPRNTPPLPPLVRLMSKHEVLAITNVSYPTIWSWMRAGTFPRSLIVGGQSKWRSSDIDQWLAQLPIRPLKGDAPVQKPSQPGAAA
jgi:predicted DNA-binding transcriptional regulator AlpA